MSMHKIPLTEVERDGLNKHGLPIDKPSQLSDAFRQGVAHGAAAEREECADIVENANTPDCGGWTAQGIADAIRARGTHEA